LIAHYEKPIMHLQLMKQIFKWKLINIHVPCTPWKCDILSVCVSMLIGILCLPFAFCFALFTFLFVCLFVWVFSSFFYVFFFFLFFLLFPFFFYLFYILYVLITDCVNGIRMLLKPLYQYCNLTSYKYCLLQKSYHCFSVIHHDTPLQARISNKNIICFHRRHLKNYFVIR